MGGAHTGKRALSSAGLAAAVVVVGLSGSHVAALDALATPPQAAQAPSYTEPQARAGRVAYERYCAACHRTDMSGSAAGPELTGPGFMSGWGARSVGELLELTRATMPPTGSVRRPERRSRRGRARPAAEGRPPPPAPGT